VIAGCTHDTAAAVAAVPAEGKDWAYLSSGTWSLIGVELTDAMINEEARAANFTNEVGYGGTIRFLKNINGLWLIQECRRAWAREGRNLAYAQIAEFATLATPHRSFIHPDDSRFHAPDDMLSAIRAYCRQTKQPIPESPGEFARCIFESLALLYGAKLDELERLTSRAIRVLHIVGGGSKNALLNQFAANATGRDVLAGPVEATAMGNVLSQALALGDIPSLAEARAIVRKSAEVVRYMPQDAAPWVTARARFAALPSK
jgi:rhamnulokinase